jgi:flagellar biosynthetic protein FliQ
MSVEMAIDVIRQAFWVALFTGAPIMAVGFVGGVIVSVVQILTSMQDPAFNTVPRLLIFIASAMLLLPWMAAQMITYSEQLLGGLERFAR